MNHNEGSLFYPNLNMTCKLTPTFVGVYSQTSFWEIYGGCSPKR